MKYSLQFIGINLPRLCINLTTVYELENNKIRLYNLYYINMEDTFYLKKLKQEYSLNKIIIEELNRRGYVNKNIIDEQIKIFRDNYNFIQTYDKLNYLLGNNKIFSQQQCYMAIKKVELMRDTLNSYKKINKNDKIKALNIK